MAEVARCQYRKLLAQGDKEIAFLVSERAGFCTGTDFAVDGGLSAGLAVK